jgi:hypothetical protein
VFEQEYLERLELQTAYTREIRQLLLLLLRRFNPQFQSQQVSQPSYFLVIEGLDVLGRENHCFRSVFTLFLNKKTKFFLRGPLPTSVADP